VPSGRPSGGGEQSTNQASRWSYSHGDFTSRGLLNRQYGGSLIKGIAASPAGSHVLLFNREVVSISSGSVHVTHYAFHLAHRPPG
jgi:hypothetical protein